MCVCVFTYYGRFGFYPCVFAHSANSHGTSSINRRQLSDTRASPRWEFRGKPCEERDGFHTEMRAISSLTQRGFQQTDLGLIPRLQFKQCIPTKNEIKKYAILAGSPESRRKSPLSGPQRARRCSARHQEAEGVGTRPGPRSDRGGVCVPFTSSLSL